MAKVKWIEVCWDIGGWRIYKKLPAGCFSLSIWHPAGNGAMRERRNTHGNLKKEMPFFFCAFQLSSSTLYWQTLTWYPVKEKYKDSGLKDFVQSSWRCSSVGKCCLACAIPLVQSPALHKNKNKNTTKQNKTKGYHHKASSWEAINW
jgi:hypothetical protein